MTELNGYNFDLASRINKYQQEMLKAEKGPQKIRDKQREEKIGGRKNNEFVKPSGNVPRVDEDIFTVNVSRDELKGGKKKKVNRLKKGTNWRDFSADTVDIGLDLGDKAWSIKDKHSATGRVQSMLGGKVNRLKKGTAWRDFSADTVGIGLDLGDKAWSIKDKHSATGRVQSMLGGNISKKRIETAINKLEAYMSGTSKLKPTKLQMEVLKHAGIIDDAVDAKKAVKRATGGGMPKQPSPWVQHCKKYARDHNVPYKVAMTEAKATYKR